MRFKPVQNMAALGWLLLFMTFGIFVSEVQAQGQTPRFLTLEDALKIAAGQNRDIQRAREFRNQVLGKYWEERAQAMPQLSATGSVAHQYDDTYNAIYKNIPVDGGGSSSGNIVNAIFPSAQNIGVVQLNVSQAIYTWGKVGAAIRAAKLGMPLAEDQLKIFQQAVARDVSAEFYNILLARQLLQVAKENLAQKQRHLDEASRKHAVGMATDYDVLAADVDVQNARPAVLQAELGVVTAKDRLRFLLTMGKDEEFDVQGTMDMPIGSYPSYEATLSVAEQNRPELSNLTHQLGIYKEVVKVTQGDSRPRLDFNGNMGMRHLAFDPFSGNGKTWSAAVTLSFPFFDGKRTAGRVQQARTDVARAEIDLAKSHDTIALQVRETVNSVEEAGEIVKALSGTVAQAERLLFMAEKGFEYGAKTRLDVEDAQSNLVQAKVNLAKAQHDYRVALVTLEWVKGTL